MHARDHRNDVVRRMPQTGRRQFCVIACHVLWRELCFYAAQSPHRFMFRFLEQGLHNTPEELRASLQRTIDEEDGEHDAVLLGYGLCSNGMVDIEARTTPLVCARAHDCITFLLGSKERYREYFDTHPGTYWYSPGWIEDSPMPGKERYESTLQHYIDLYGEDSARYLMETTENWMQKYGLATYVDLGVGDSEAYREYTRACAEWLDWECDFQEGDPALLKNLLEGNWDDEDFLIVPPGYRIEPSFDNRIVKAVSAKRGDEPPSQPAPGA